MRCMQAPDVMAVVGEAVPRMETHRVPTTMSSVLSPLLDRDHVANTTAERQWGVRPLLRRTYGVKVATSNYNAGQSASSTDGSVVGLVVATLIGVGIGFFTTKTWNERAQSEQQQPEEKHVELVKDVQTSPAKLSQEPIAVAPNPPAASTTACPKQVLQQHCPCKRMMNDNIVTEREEWYTLLQESRKRLQAQREACRTQLRQAQQEFKNERELWYDVLQKEKQKLQQETEACRSEFAKLAKKWNQRAWGVCSDGS